MQTNLLLAVLQLPDRARDGEAATVREELKKRRRGTLRLNEILPQVLLRLLAPHV